MKILDLFQQQQLNITGVWRELLAENDFYSLAIVHLPAKVETNVHGDLSSSSSFYVINGRLELVVYNNSREVGKKFFGPDQGWSLLPEQQQKLKTEDETLVFVVSAPLGSSKLKDISGRNPLDPQKINELSNYLVTKPWGSEAWFVENGLYVLKGITMNTGEKCSLQLHEQKIEANLVLRGSAEITVGYDEQLKKDIIKHRQAGKKQADFVVKEETVEKVKANMQSILINKYEGWKINPFQIHRVFSQAKYFALEVSTPEVDDIIRLQDNYNRPGGRINSEHQNK